MDCETKVYATNRSPIEGERKELLTLCRPGGVLRDFRERIAVFVSGVGWRLDILRQHHVEDSLNLREQHAEVGGGSDPRDFMAMKRE